MLVVCKKNKLAKIKEENECYYAIKLTKKIGNAVVRNKIRRRIKHILRDLVKLESNMASFTLIIIPKKTCKKYDFAKLENEFYDTCKQILN